MEVPPGRVPALPAMAQDRGYRDYRAYRAQVRREYTCHKRPVEQLSKLSKLSN